MDRDVGSSEIVVLHDDPSWGLSSSPCSPLMLCHGYLTSADLGEVFYHAVFTWWLLILYDILSPRAAFPPRSAVLIPLLGIFNRLGVQYLVDND